MAKNNVVEQGKPGNTPITKELRRAGARIGYTPSVAELETEGELDRTDEELDQLRSIASLLERSFYFNGPSGKDPTNVLTEALGAASEDFNVIAAADEAGSGVPYSAFHRAELRCRAALALFEYRQSFGYPSDEDIEQANAEFLAATGGAS